MTVCQPRPFWGDAVEMHVVFNAECRHSPKGFHIRFLPSHSVTLRGFRLTFIACRTALYAPESEYKYTWFKHSLSGRQEIRRSGGLQSRGADMLIFTFPPIICFFLTLEESNSKHVTQTRVFLGFSFYLYFARHNRKLQIKVCWFCACSCLVQQQQKNRILIFVCLALFSAEYLFALFSLQCFFFFFVFYPVGIKHNTV